MPPSKDPSERPGILFCPFCRDGFEGRLECPEHELSLVTIDRLPRKAKRTLESVTFFGDPRLGRGTVLLGAAVALLWILWRRRSRRAMRAACAAVLGLAVGGALPLIYTTRRIGLVAEAHTAQVEWQSGLWLMAAGLLLAAFGSRRMGVAAGALAGER
jgi:hypothetical protein